MGDIHERRGDNPNPEGEIAVEKDRYTLGLLRELDLENESDLTAYFQKLAMGHGRLLL